MLDAMYDLVVSFLHNPACILIWVALNFLGAFLQKATVWPSDWNKFIPVVLFVLGMILTPFLVPVTVFPATQPHPKTLLAILGFIFGVLAWFTHTVPLQWFLKKFGADPAAIDKP